MVVYHGQKPLRVLAQGLLVVNKAYRCLPEVQGPCLTLDVRAGLEPLKGRRSGIKFEVGWDGHTGDTKQPGHLRTGNASQTSVVCLHLFTPAKIKFERPHWYLIRRIFRVLAVLPKSRE